MKEHMNGFLQTIKRRKKTAIGIVVLLLILFFAFSRNGNKGTGEATVTREDIAQEVAVTGKTVAVQDVSLGFDRGGRVGYAPVSVGSRVVAGQTIASLDASDLSANRAKAAADLSEAMVKLEQITRTSQGSSAEARSTLIATIKSSYADSDDALRNSIDQFFKNPRQSSTYIEFSFKDGNTEYKFPLPYDVTIPINSERYLLEEVLTSWERSIRSIDTASDLTPYIIEAETNLNRIKNFLNNVAFAANLIESVDYQYTATINGYKTTVAAARTSVNIAVTNFITKKNNFISAPSQLGSTGKLDEIALQEARVASVRAQLASADAELAKATIRAPFDGLVTKQDAKVGETVSAGQGVVSVISDKNLEIEANISEVNIGKVSIGNSVTITFDAYPGKEFTGELFYIEPAETLIDNVVNYKIKVTLLGDIEEIKSGLTANLRITTATKQGVLTVPLFSIIEEDGESYVDKKVGDKTERIEVQTGLVGNNSKVEISGNINEGDMVTVLLVQ